MMFSVFQGVQLDDSNWGSANMDVIPIIFSSIIQEFSQVLGPSWRSPHPLVISHWDKEYPMCCKNSDNTVHIFLTSKDNYWSQYTYQFAHEFCHFIIDGPLDGKLESSFWFEESICEMASMFFLRKVADCWKNPILEFPRALQTFAPNNITYLENLIQQYHNIDIPLRQWILQKMDVLNEDRYNRKEYNMIAKALLPLFEDNPQMWKIVPFLKRIPLEQYVDFNHFIKEFVKSNIPKNITQLYNEFANLVTY